MINEHDCVVLTNYPDTLVPIVLPFLASHNRPQVRIRKNLNQPMRTVYRNWSRQ
jgi:hypothetical protein